MSARSKSDTEPLWKSIIQPYPLALIVIFSSVGYALFGIWGLLLGLAVPIGAIGLVALVALLVFLIVYGMINEAIEEVEDG